AVRVVFAADEVHQIAGGLEVFAQREAERMRGGLRIGGRRSTARASRSSSARADFARLPAQPRPTAALPFSRAAASSSFQMGGPYFNGMRINPATIAITPAMVMAKGKPCWLMRIVDRMPP